MNEADGSNKSTVRTALAWPSGVIGGRKISGRILALSLLSGLLIAFWVKAGRPVPYPGSSQFRDGVFENPVSPQIPTWDEAPSLWLRFAFEKRARARPVSPLPVQRISAAQLDRAADGTVYRLGHSTVLLKLDGAYWITDPVFSDRASPVQWAGPKRMHPTPIGIDELPPLAGVILSHDHYDHLDKATVLALSSKTALFMTPLGVGDLLIGWGIPKAKVRQLDWWDSIRVGDMTFVATPAQHFSGRGPGSGNATLWSSWVIKSSRYSVFFSGDSGYFDGFSTIGRRYGPFDLTLIESGSYDDRWRSVHLLPDDTIRAHKDLGGKTLLPIHNSTFDLAFHPWNAPLDAVSLLASRQDVRLATPRFGEAVQLDQLPVNQPWWRRD